MGLWSFAFAMWGGLLLRDPGLLRLLAWRRGPVSP
jgi:hypothetical protein